MSDMRKITMKAVLFDEETAESKGVGPGWWVVDDIGTPLFGPYPSREAAVVAIGKNSTPDEFK
jgi:hypothetical protein